MKMPVVLFLLLLRVSANDASKFHAPYQPPSHPTGTESRDFCMHESFNVSCKYGSVILMTSAVYGRMRTGRCISGDFNIGCAKDVVAYFDSRCSLRQSCDVTVRDLVDIHPCQRDFTSYLDASYKCIEVSTSGLPSCPQIGQVVLPERQTGYIAGSIGSFYSSLMSLSYSSAIGGDLCPWIVRVSVGQRLSLHVTLVHAQNNVTSASRLADEQITCSAKLVVVEDDVLLTSMTIHSSQRDIVTDDVIPSTATTTSRYDLCSGKFRERYVHTSQGHEVTVYILRDPAGRERQQTERNYPRFVISYEAVGCPNLYVPPNARLTKMGNSNVMIRCNDTMESTTWYLTCQQNRWIGDSGNCTTRSVVLAVMIGVVLGMFIGMLLLLLILCTKHKSKRFKIDRAGDGSSFSSFDRYAANSRSTGRYITGRKYATGGGYFSGGLVNHSRQCVYNSSNQHDRQSPIRGGLRYDRDCATGAGLLDTSSMNNMPKARSNDAIERVYEFGDDRGDFGPCCYPLLSTVGDDDDENTDDHGLVSYSSRSKGKESCIALADLGNQKSKTGAKQGNGVNKDIGKSAAASCSSHYSPVSFMTPTERLSIDEKNRTGAKDAYDRRNDRPTSVLGEKNWEMSSNAESIFDDKKTTLSEEEDCNSNNAIRGGLIPCSIIGTVSREQATGSSGGSTWGRQGIRSSADVDILPTCALCILNDMCKCGEPTVAVVQQMQPLEQHRQQQSHENNDSLLARKNENHNQNVISPGSDVINRSSHDAATSMSVLNQCVSLCED